MGVGQAGQSFVHGGSSDLIAELSKPGSIALSTNNEGTAMVWRGIANARRDSVVVASREPKRREYAGVECSDTELPRAGDLRTDTCHLFVNSDAVAGQVQMP